MNTWRSSWRSNEARFAVPEELSAGPGANDGSAAPRALSVVDGTVTAHATYVIGGQSRLCETARLRIAVRHSVDQFREIFLARNGDGAERCEMRFAPLHVEQRHPARPHQIDERHQRDFRGVPPAMEHRLAREEAVDSNAVQPPAS